MTDAKDGMNLFEKRAAAQREGGMLMLYSLVEDGALDLTVASGKAGVEEEEFLRRMREAGFSTVKKTSDSKTAGEDAYAEVTSADSGEDAYAEVMSADSGENANEEVTVSDSGENAYAEETVSDSGENAYAEVPAAVSGEGAFAEVPAIDSQEDAYTEVPAAENDGKEIAGYTEVPARIPTEEEKKTYGPEDVGLVLSGGGGKGAYQIGVLRALAEEGQLDHVAAVAGTSIGAVNAVLFAQGDFDKAYKTWDDIDMGVLFDIDPAMLAQGKIYFSRDEMNRLMNQYIDYSRLAASDLEIYCGVAEELGNGNYRAEYMRLNGRSISEIQNILMASTAMPVVYDTVLINGKPYRDGGVADNEPVRPLYDAGLRKFILVNLDFDRVFHPEQFPGAEFIVIDPSRHLGDILEGTLNFNKDDKTIKRTLGYKDGKRAIKVLIEKDPAYIAMAPALAERDYEETVREYQREKRVSALEQSVSSSFDYIAELEKKYEF